MLGRLGGRGVLAAGAGSEQSPTEWVGFGKIKHEVPKLYAIPTTSGTGSEATMGAVISDSETHAKNIISDGSLLPALAALEEHQREIDYYRRWSDHYGYLFVVARKAH